MDKTAEKCIFTKPDETMLKEIASYRAAFLSAGEKLCGAGLLMDFESPSDWLHHNQISEHKETVPAGRVPSEQFVLFREADKKIVGMIQFRHECNDFTREYGGHIGYSVRPDERGRGYAKQMLSRCLILCREFGLERVLLTCRTDNEASKRTILSCGGAYERTVYCERDDVHLERYWISLTD